MRPLTMLRSMVLPLLLMVGLAPATVQAQPQNRRGPDPSTTMASPSLKALFHDAIGDAQKATVRVRTDGKDAALGAVVGAEGYVLTKASEVEGGKITVALADGTELPAKITGLSDAHDLVMLKIDAGRPLATVKWLNATETTPRGEMVATVAAIGSDPVAVGVISVEKRRIPGAYGVLGIQLEDGAAGVRIANVVPDSGAAKAGLLADDVITAFMGKTVVTREALVALVQEHKPGDRVSLVVRRGDSSLDVTATLGLPIPVRPNARPNRQDTMNHMGGDLSARNTGFPTVLQHDTVLKPSDCGGPLVNLDGKVVGLNIARAGRTESYALPADVVQGLIADMESGKLMPDMIASTQPAAMMNVSTTRPSGH